MTRGIENGRAKHAYDNAKNKNASHIKKMPMMIQINGLAQTIAFYDSKDDRKDIVRSLEDWLFTINSTGIFDESKSGNKLSEYVISCTQEEYQLITAEIMNYLQWMRRFAEARGEENTDESTTNSESQ